MLAPLIAVATGSGPRAAEPGPWFGPPALQAVELNLALQALALCLSHLDRATALAVLAAETPDWHPLPAAQVRELTGGTRVGGWHIAPTWGNATAGSLPARRTAQGAPWQVELMRFDDRRGVPSCRVDLPPRDLDGLEAVVTRQAAAAGLDLGAWSYHPLHGPRAMPEIGLLMEVFVAGGRHEDRVISLQIDVYDTDEGIGGVSITATGASE